MPEVQNFSAGTRQSLVLAFALVLGTALSFAFGLLPLKLAGGALIGIVLAALALRHPVWGLASLCAILTIEGIAASQLGMTEIRLFGAAVFGLWLVHLVAYGKPLRINRTFTASILFLIWAGVSFLWAEDPRTAGPYYATLAQLVLLYLLTVNVVESEKDFRLVLAALLLGAVATSFMSVSLFVTNLFERARTFEAQNANQYASVVGLALIGGVYLVWRLKNRALRVGIFLMTCYLAFPLILAQSRTAWLSVTAAMVVFLWHTKRRLRNLIIVTVALAGIIFTTFATGLVNITVVERASELVGMGRKTSDRIDIWRVAARVIYDHPVAGAGFMQFPVVYNRYRSGTHGIRKDMDPRRDAHNVYLGVAADLGIAGLALMLLIFWRAWREEDLPKAAAPWISKAFLVYLMVFSLGGSVYRDKFFWIALALAVKVRSLAADSLSRRQEVQ
ncbi:MAG TPA: O-antigen ligase family protein [archaeon]|nr:O-antigen ligase family protein [archaeon]